MIAEQYKEMLNGKSVIRELSEYATARGKEIGYKYSKEKSCVWQQSFEYSVKMYLTTAWGIRPCPRRKALKRR